MNNQVTVQQIVQYTKQALSSVENYYGVSKHHNTLPHVFLSEERADGRKGEFCSIINEITLYYNNLTNLEDLVKTLIHEYQHYLQSPSWFTRYYNMGYSYNDHPYEIQASNEEQKWKQVWKQAS